MGVHTVFGRNIQALIDSNDSYTQESVAKAIDSTITSVNGWINRGVQPRRSNIDRIKEAFGLTDDDLLSEENGLYARMNAFKQSFGLPLKTSPESAFLPYLGHAHAGEFADPLTIDDNVVEVPKSVADRHPRGRVITVDGDCVNRVIPSGSIAVVDPDVEPQSGSLVCASIDSGDFILRRMFRGGRKLMLSPDSFNEEYDDMIFDENDDHELDLIGTVVWHQAARELD